MATSGLRIGEAIAIKWSDFDGDLLQISRRICDREVDKVKTERSARVLPIPSELLERMKTLGAGEWVFRSREGTPVNPGNALNRYVRPVAKELGIAIGGWHDFRHTVTTTMRRNKEHPKVGSGILGHSKVALAMNFYDHLMLKTCGDLSHVWQGSCYEMLRKPPSRSENLSTVWGGWWAR